MRLGGARDPGTDPLLEVRVAPFIVPAMDGLGALGAGKAGAAIESRLVLLPGADALGVLEGVADRETLPDEPLEPSCFVGDLLGDYANQSLVQTFEM